MSLIQLDIHQHVATVTLNRPEQGNSIDLASAKEMMDVAIACSEDDNIRSVVLTGAGKAFCVGGDIKTFAADADEIGAAIKHITSYFHQAISHWVNMQKPFIGAINGVAAGGGMSLALSCDLLYAAQNSKFVMAYNQIGFSPDGAGSYFLPRLVGVRRALELLYTNRALSADEALDWGLLNGVLPEAELLPHVQNLAQRLAQGPTQAFGLTKRLMYQSYHNNVDAQMALEAQTLAAQSQSAEGLEGVRAFLEKRPPIFSN